MTFFKNLFANNSNDDLKEHLNKIEIQLSYIKYICEMELYEIRNTIEDFKLQLKGNNLNLDEILKFSDNLSRTNNMILEFKGLVANIRSKENTRSKKLKEEEVKTEKNKIKPRRCGLGENI